MKKSTILCLVALVVLCWSCDNAVEVNESSFRSADPCNTWAKPGWKDTPDSIRTPELQLGRASHATVANIIYYSVIENSDVYGQGKYYVNPVLMLVYLENNELLSKGKEFGDFELRLLHAYNFGGPKINKYSGFYPQTVSATYQWRRYQEKGLSFDSAQVLFSFASGKNFKAIYAECAETMNSIAGTNFAKYPDAKGYYQDFFGVVKASHIQQFLVARGSSLAADVFRQAPVVNTSIDYKNLGIYCE